MSFHMALQNLKQNEDEPVSQFLQRAKTIVTEPQTASDAIRTSTFNMHVLKGLKSDFQSVISSLLMQPTIINFDDLHSILLCREFLQGVTFGKPTLVAASSDLP
ncbi:hypothetical protein Droror1_Dr00008621 [Drosera rotundifolia]